MTSHMTAHAYRMMDAAPVVWLDGATPMYRKSDTSCEAVVLDMQSEE